MPDKLFQVVRTIDAMDRKWADRADEASVQDIHKYYESMGDMEQRLHAMARAGNQAASLALHVIGLVQYIEFAEEQDRLEAEASAETVSLTELSGQPEINLYQGSYDDIVGRAWSMRVDEQYDAAEILLAHHGLPTDKIMTDGK